VREEPLKDQPVETAVEVVATALTAVPVAGGALAEIATRMIRYRQNRRLNKFLIDLAADMQRTRQSEEPLVEGVQEPN